MDLGYYLAFLLLVWWESIFSSFSCGNFVWQTTLCIVLFEDVNLVFDFGSFLRQTFWEWILISHSHFRINAYNATNYNKTLDRVFRYGWIAIVSLFVAEFVYDLINGFYGVGNIFWTTMIVYVVVIGVGALTLSILFLVYSHKLYHRLKSFKNEKLNQRKNLKKVNFIFFHPFINCFVSFL